MILLFKFSPTTKYVVSQQQETPWFAQTSKSVLMNQWVARNLTPGPRGPGEDSYTDIKAIMRVLRTDEE